MYKSRRPKSVSTTFTAQQSEDYEEPRPATTDEGVQPPWIPAEAGDGYAGRPGLRHAGVYADTGHLPNSKKGGVMGDTLLPASEELRCRWPSVQVSFVDSPRDAVP